MELDTQHAWNTATVRSGTMLAVRLGNCCLWLQTQLSAAQVAMCDIPVREELGTLDHSLLSVFSVGCVVLLVGRQVFNWVYVTVGGNLLRLSHAAKVIWEHMG